MGYCSTYIITPCVDDENKAKEILDAIEKRSGYNIEENGSPDSGIVFDAKWYDSEDDLVEVSKEFPEVVIEMDVEGEERDDNWTIRVKNGEKEIVRAKTVTPPFTKILKEGEQKLDRRTCNRSRNAETQRNRLKQIPMKPFTTYITVRIDGQYDPSRIDVEEAVETAVNRVVAEAQSTAEFEGDNGGIEITDVVNCGEAV